MNPLSLAYSPDTDDAFMMIPLMDGHVESKYSIDFQKDDISVLNQLAIEQQKYDVSAISVATFPYCSQHYVILDVGASIGNDYGPVLVARADDKRSTEEILSGIVAIPGKKTSAYISAYELYDGFVSQEMCFLDIIPALTGGDVDAGILIHEAQMNPENYGLRVLSDLGKDWMKKHRHPLPLGVNVAKRSLGMDLLIDLQNTLRQSIQYSFDQREDILKIALASSVTKNIAFETGDEYIDRYVNSETLKMSTQIQDAIDYFFELAAKKDLLPKVDQPLFINLN